VAIDGVVMHRDETNPVLLHAYLLSYERHTLIGHYVISMDQDVQNQEIEGSGEKALANSVKEICPLGEQ
jgi:hypothetical protein